MRDRAHELYGVANARRPGDFLEPLLLALVAVARVLTQHEQPRIGVTASAQLSQRANGDVDTLQTLEPANEKQQRTRARADLGPSLEPVDRPEGPQVDARRHDFDASRVGAV